MPFFAMPYRVLFHDTMAYGSHHYLTNFKFQNIARETILFESRIDGRLVSEEQLKDIVVLTREAYSLNLGPVLTGQRVAILLSYEDPSRSSVRLCFRVIRQDGQPVSCGYQTMVCVDKDSLELAPAPRLVTQYLDTSAPDCLIERLTSPSFADRLKSGRRILADIFPDSIIELGKSIANLPERESYWRIAGERPRESVAPVPAKLPEAKSGVVFVFPGQGSFRPQLLREIYRSRPELAQYFHEADETARRLLGQDFLRVILAESASEQVKLRSSNPDMSQIGIYLAGALVARLLTERGAQAELLLGHSFGEFAALAAAGVYSIGSGVELICRRILALRSSGARGAMAAASCSAARMRELLDEAAPHSIEIAVINHQNQTVISGPSADLDALQKRLTSKGISLTQLDSPFPFHSSALKPAVDLFRKAASGFSFSAAQIPVLHCTEQRLFAVPSELPEILARQFVQQLDFAGILRTLRSGGFHTFIECGGGDIVTRIVLKNLAGDSPIKAVAAGPGIDGNGGLDNALQTLGIAPVAHEDAPPIPDDPPAAVPVAIVGMGCVLPGAANAGEYWSNICKGVSGIVDIAALDPNAKADFVAGHVDASTANIIPDKTYTLLNGSILDVRFDAAILGHLLSEQEFARLTRGQKLLALALAQSLAGIAPDRRPKAAGAQLILGATADGSTEFDEAALVETLANSIDQLDEPASSRTHAHAALERVFGYDRGDASKLTQNRIYRDVVDMFLPGGMNTYVVDSACSSSLYAVNLGMKALAQHEADVVLAGGVFAPGPANNTLFAQFRGLSPTGSRPLDKDADGVVFGDGAAILILKRLDDALVQGDRVLAVIRGMGLSSDGRSPSINVPQANGQALAIRRALEQAGVAAETVQYIEAHATATPVGDKVEVGSLSQVFRGRPETLPPIELGSVKALIGHTGWVSGAASIVKICKALEERTIPGQRNFRSPDPLLGLEQSPFRISPESRPWPENTGGLPRRAGVNGFGFGGTNAHLILEEFREPYHRKLCSRLTKQPNSDRVCIVGAGALFPAEGKLDSAVPTARLRFARETLRLPKKKILLPDITDHMDVSQYLASLAAEQILDSMPAKWTAIREETGVVLGFTSKTERGLSINNRIFLDRVGRLLLPEARKTPDLDRVLTKLAASVRSTYLPSGPYTLPGLMPNLAASRVSALFDLKGPNLVVDAGANSLFQSLLVASQLLAHGDCKMVLAGGVSAVHGTAASVGETACLLALTTESVARECGFRILATMALGAPVAGCTGLAEPLDYGACRGVTQLLAALERADKHRSSISVPEPVPLGTGSRTLRIESADPETRAPEQPAGQPGIYAYVQGTPIYRFEPVLREKAATSAALSLIDRKVLVLSDRPDRWNALRQSGITDALPWRVVLAGTPLESEWDKADYDTILALSFLDGQTKDGLLTGDPERDRGLLDLLFATCRHKYDSIREGRVAVLSLSMGSIDRGVLSPATGMMAGFLKSLARELPDARVAIVNTDEPHLFKALKQCELELGANSSDREVCYIDGIRHVFGLKSIENLSVANRPYLGADSVVLATGGGRGVTAVLGAELLRRFGCTVVAVGRIDPQSAPTRIRSMSPEALADYERTFYKEELAREPGQKIPDLKRKFAAWQAANEVAGVIEELCALPGRFHYCCADITRRQDMERLIEEIYGKYGRIDMVLHGAGVQVSGALARKSPADFQRIVNTKLAGLAYIYQAVEKKRSGRPVHYHLLTSAFSYLGNDGQPDYGAANETLNRIAAVMNNPRGGPYWSSMAWLGWAGIGMTRGSEFAALAASRRLRGVTREEGSALFGELMAGPPASAINILLADGEIRHYGVDVSQPPASIPAVRKTEETYQWSVSLAEAPFLRDHMVSGFPTLPAAFFTCAVADAAKKLRPDLKVTAYEDTHYRRFLRVPPGGAKFRVCARVIEEDGNQASVKVQILSDFVHKSGRVLEADIVNNETIVRMARELPKPPRRIFDVDVIDGRSLPDPYLLRGSRVKLNGIFASTRNICVGSSQRLAEYQLSNYRYPESNYGHLLPNMILVDAFWRFGTVQLLDESRLGVYVPVQCQTMRVYFDYLAFDLPALLGRCTFRGTNPRIDSDLLHVGPIDVTDDRGNVLLVVEGGVCRKFGEVELEGSHTAAANVF